MQEIQSFKSLSLILKTMVFFNFRFNTELAVSANQKRLKEAGLNNF